MVANVHRSSVWQISQNPFSCLLPAGRLVVQTSQYLQPGMYHDTNPRDRPSFHIRLSATPTIRGTNGQVTAKKGSRLDHDTLKQF